LEGGGVAATWVAGAGDGPYCTEATWLIGYVRASPVAACSAIESVELLVTAPVKVEPSFKVTVACCWVAGAGADALLHPPRVASATIIGITIFKRME
jgi:hypothetical protein